MDSSTSLLSSHSNSAKLIPSLEDIIEQHIGGFGWAQLLQSFLLSLAWLFDAQQTFITVFSDKDPAWHCTDQLTCTSKSNICKLPKSSWAWDLPLYTSTKSEWSLQCANSIVAGMPSSAYFMGCFVGGLFIATMADTSLGRKNLLSLSCLTMSVSALLTVFSTNIWIYTILRFLTGCGRASVGTCSLVLVSEIIGKRWRGQVGIFSFLSFTFGFLSLPGIAYLNRSSSWRTLYLFTSIPGILYCIPVHFFVSDSPRWLLMHGREEEAIMTLKKFSPPQYRHTELSLSSTGTTHKQGMVMEVGFFSSMKMLMQKKWAVKRLVAGMVLGFGIGTVYFGMPLGVENLSVDLYLGVALNALMEIPAMIISVIFIDKWNRKSSLIAFNIISGVFSVICSVLSDQWEALRLGFELVSFVAAYIAFAVLLIYVLELFPTCVRNSALSMVRQAVVVGGVITPVLVAAGKRNAFMSHGVFGLVIGFSGLLVVWLPETRGVRLYDTMDEQEENEIAA